MIVCCILSMIDEVSTSLMMLLVELFLDALCAMAICIINIHHLKGFSPYCTVFFAVFSAFRALFVSAQIWAHVDHIQTEGSKKSYYVTQRVDTERRCRVCLSGTKR